MYNDSIVVFPPDSPQLQLISSVEDIESELARVEQDIAAAEVPKPSPFDTDRTFF
jgi:hypothetical protein